MAGKSRVTAGEEQRNALLTLAHSRDRGEADRARAILLTLSGWSSPRIAEAFSVREDTVRLWRSEFARGGVEALKATWRPARHRQRPKPRCVSSRLCWKLQSPTGPTGRSPALWPRSRRARASGSADRNCPRRCEKKLPLAAAPAHAERPPKRRRDRARGAAPSVAQGQGRAGDVILLYGDESEALTHPYLARAWALRGADLRVPAPGQAKKVAIIGSLDHVTRQLIVHTSPTKRSSDFIAHLEQLDFLYGPQRDGQ